MNANRSTNLRDFIAQVFIPEREAKRGKPISKFVHYRLRVVVALLTTALRRCPMVSDLSDASIAAVHCVEVNSRRASLTRLFNDYFLALWGCAYRLDILADPPPGPGERWREEEAELSKLRWTQEQIDIIGTLPPKEAAAELKVSISAVYYARHNLRMLHGTAEKNTRGRFNSVKKLSQDDGTLNHIMLTKYFPRNQRIRDLKTKTAYDLALRNFRDSLGHEPTAADLNDEAVEMFQVYLRDKKLSAKTINERVGRVVALWNWLAKKGLSECFPAINPLQEQRRTPQAWTQEQLARLFDACRREPGNVGSIPAGKFWEALNLVLWDTGARIGELLALRWEWLDWETGFITVPAEVRKGGMQDAVYNLHSATLALLAEIEDHSRDLIFPWPLTECSLYNHYSRILKRAGLPRDRKSKFHRMRKSVASHLQAAGVDASQSLGHSSSAITRESYLDPTIVNGRKTHEVLFRPQAAPQAVSVPSKPPVIAPVIMADVDAMAFL